VNLGDLVCIDWNQLQNRLTFVREGEGALVQQTLPQGAGAAVAGKAESGKSTDTPAESTREERKTRTAQPSGTAAVPQARKKPER
jgi:hypothetical protein